MTDLMSKAWDAYWADERESNTERALERVVAMLVAECAKAGSKEKIEALLTAPPTCG